MKKWTGLLAVMLAAMLFAGCAAGTTAAVFTTGGQAEAEGQAASVFVAHGYLKNEAVTALDGALFAFMPKEGGDGAREYLYALDEGGKARILCAKPDCAHETQSTLSDPCNAWSYATQGLMAYDGALYAASRNGGVGLVRYDPAGGAPETVLTAEREMACFLICDGAIYYAQQDQSLGDAAPATPESGYRLMKRALDGAPGEAPDEAVYTRSGAVGYISCVQEIGGQLYLTEIYKPEGETQARMDIVRIDADGANPTVFAQNAGGHYIAQVGDRLAVSRQNAQGTWDVVLINPADGSEQLLETGAAPYMLCGLEGYLLADGGGSMPTESRDLVIYDAQGERIGSRALPETYGCLLGMDSASAYYWSAQPGGVPTLEKVSLK